MESEATHKAPSNKDPLQFIVATLSDLPTESALRELNRGKSNGAVRQVIETMALHKNDLVGAISIIANRENLAMKMLEQHYNLEEMAKLAGVDLDKAKISFDVSPEN